MKQAIRHIHLLNSKIADNPKYWYIRGEDYRRYPCDIRRYQTVYNKINRAQTDYYGWLQSSQSQVTVKDS